MPVRRPTLVWLVVLAALVLAAGPAAADDPPTDPPPPAPAPTLMVVGDSISSTSRYGEYSADGKVKAWWAYVAQAVGAAPKPTVSAQPGSGMVKRGRVGGTFAEADDPDARCTGSTFGQRLSAITEARPTLLVIEGGRNDFKICVSDGTSRIATSEQTRRGVSSYLQRLRAVTDAAGVKPRNVFVVTPWGTAYAKYRDVVTYNIEKYAAHYGFTYVPVPILSNYYTYDGTHPNSRGTRKLASMILEASDIALRAHADADDTRVTPVRTACTGLRDCGDRYGKVAYGSVRTTSFWGQRPDAGGTNYIAYRLSHGGRHNKPLAGRTAVEWRSSARRDDKISITGVPKVGSVAWWPRNPDDGSRKGHVAYVVKVYSGSVLVQEELAGHRYRVTRYAGTAYPRGFIAFPK